MRGLLQVVLVLLYPAVVYLALRQGSVRLAAGGVVLLLAIRFLLASPGEWRRLPTGVREGIALALGLGVLAGVADIPELLLLLPVAVSAIGLGVFGVSLRGVPLVEQLARRERSDLLPEEVRYCRTVTLVWCAFFLANGLFSFWLAIYGPLGLWALYTGCIAYLLIGTLFVGEWIVRRIRFGERASSPIDELRRVWATRLR